MMWDVLGWVAAGSLALLLAGMSTALVIVAIKAALGAKVTKAEVAPTAKLTGTVVESSVVSGHVIGREISRELDGRLR